MKVNHSLEDTYYKVLGALKSRKDKSLVKAFYEEVKRVLNIYESLTASINGETDKKEEAKAPDEPKTE